MGIPQKLIGCRSAIVAINVAIGLLFGISRAHAQNAQAESLFNEGNRLMAAGELAQACEVFEASNRIEPRVVQYFASLDSPDENGTIDRTNDARVFLGKVDYQLNTANLFTIRYNYTWSEQQNGTFDVDSWGRSANAIERDFSNTISTQLNTTISPTTPRMSQRRSRV